MRRTVFLGLALLTSCGDAAPATRGDADAAAIATTPDARPATGRITIAPASVLLTAPGEQVALSAEALDVGGQPLAGPITWTSSSPDLVSVDETGRITAVAQAGSAQITATAAGVTSRPVLVVVAQPAAGAVLVSDDQVVAGPTAVDPAVPLDLGSRVQLSLAPSVAVTPGDILLAREAKPVGGRVVSARPGAAGTDVVLEIVPLPELFARLELRERYLIDAAVYEAAPDEALPAKRPLLGLDSYQCEESIGSSVRVSGNAALRLTPDVNAEWQLVVADGELSLLHVSLTGTLTATGTVSLMFEAGFAGTLSCRAVLKRIPLPVTGALSIVAGLQVPIGLKAEITGGVVAARLQLGGEVKVTSRLGHGFTYTPATGFVPHHTSDSAVELKPTLGLLQPGMHVAVEVKLGVGPTAGLDAGIQLPLLGGASLGLLEASLLLQLGATVYDWLSELVDTLASKYDAKIILAVGPGKDAAKALSFLGGRGPIGLKISTEKSLARSPTGSMTPDRPEVRVGEPVTFTVRLDPSTFLGLDNVQEIRIYRAASDGAPPELVATLGGGAVASWTWTPAREHAGPQFFWAFVVPRFGSVPLEIKEDSHVRVDVVSDGPKRWEGLITFEASGADSEQVDPQHHSTYSVMGSGSVMVKERASAPPGTGILDEVSASATVTHTTVTTFTPAPPTNPNTCVYRRTTTDTNSGAALAADREPLAAQLMLNPATGDYALFFRPPKLDTTFRSETVSSLAHGPGTCSPGDTTSSAGEAHFLWEDLHVIGRLDPPTSGTLSGTATLRRGSDPVTMYTLTWTLVGRP